MQAHIYPIYPMVEAQALCFHHWVNAIMKFSLHRLRRIAPSGIGYHMTHIRACHKYPSRGKTMHGCLQFQGQNIKTRPYGGAARTLLTDKAVSCNMTSTCNRPVDGRIASR